MLLHVIDKQEAKILSWLQKGTLKKDYRLNLSGIYKYAKRGLYLATNGASLFAVKQEQLPVLAELPDGSIHVLNDNKTLGKSANQYLEAESVLDTMPDLEPAFMSVDPEKATASLHITTSILKAMLEMPHPGESIILRMFADERHQGMLSIESLDGVFVAFCASRGWVESATTQVVDEE